MQEKGTIVVVEPGRVTVSMSGSRRSKCLSCGLCQAAADNRMLMDVRTDGDWSVGDAVTVEIPGPGPGASAALLLGIPIILFIAGLAVGEWLRESGRLSIGSGVSVLIGLGAMALAYAAAALYDRHLRRSPRHQPRIVKDAGS